MPQGKAKHPVVYVDLDDARAYAQWAGKRLPREEEWQYAAQGNIYYSWPWRHVYDPRKCNGDGDNTTPVDAYLDGASPLGCLDMVGNVWELTESERNTGHTRFVLLRGGSYKIHYADDMPKGFGPGFYLPTGPIPCDAHVKLPLIGPSLDRSPNIGFRCVKDATDGQGWPQPGQFLV